MTLVFMVFTMEVYALFPAPEKQRQTDPCEFEFKVIQFYININREILSPDLKN